MLDHLTEACRDAIEELIVALNDPELCSGPNRRSGLAALRALDPRIPAEYLLLLHRWSSAQRLTGWRTQSERLRRGLIPSLAGVPLIGADEHIVDVGSGAGLPGLALAMVKAGASCTLVESRRKRASFLMEARRKLDLDVRVENRRIEELPFRPFGQEKVIVTARAFSEPERVLQTAGTLGADAALIWLGEADWAAASESGRPSTGFVSGATFGEPGGILRFELEEASEPATKA